MKNKFNMYLVGVLMCAAALFTVMACEKDEEKAKPGKAGISVVSETDNKCGTEVEPFVILGVTAENATSYKWYKNGTALSSTGTGEALTVSESGTYTAAGVNDQGEGAVSDAKIVTIADCGAPVIIGDEHNDCGEGETTVELSIEQPIANATSYKWYKDDAPIDGATATTYTVEESGTYTVAGVYASGEGAKSAPKVVTITGCAAPIPDAAGTIDGDNANTCPDETVELTIGAITNATSYQWYRNGTAIGDATSQTLTVTLTLPYTMPQSASYTVAGVNEDMEEGPRSDAHLVTITSCAPVKPVTPFTSSGATTNDCENQQTTLQIYTNHIEGATTVTWYALQEGGSSVSVKTSAQSVDGSRSYDVEESGTYVVRGFNDWNPGPVSEPIEVTITPCDPLSIVPQGTPVIITGSGEIIVDGTATRICGMSTTLALDNLKNPGAEGIAGGLPITGALSYTWYRYSDPITPVEMGTKTNINFYGTQLTVTEGGTYTVIARNDIGDGEESAPVVVEWIPCPPAAPAWSAVGDVSGCIGTTVKLQINLPFVNAPGTYVWYKDGTEVARQTGEDRNEYTVTDDKGGVYTVAAVDAAEGEGAQNTGRTVTFGVCGGEVITDATYADFPASATFDVYDTQGANMAMLNATQYTVTIEKGVAGTQLKIIGLGGSAYGAGIVWGYFNNTTHAIDITTGSDGGTVTGLTNGEDEIVWIAGPTANDIAAIAKIVNGKIYIYISASGMPPASYTFNSATAGYEGSPGFFHMATGVDATEYHGTGYATVLVQQ
jgi:hypothetical protein